MKLTLAREVKRTRWSAYIHGHQLSEEGRYELLDPVDWSVMGRNSLGLTQTCRQIRTEFLPIHRRQTTVSVREKYADRYVSDFLTPLGICESKESFDTFETWYM